MLKRLALATILFSLAIVYAYESGREEVHPTYPLAAAGRVSVSNINGAVHVTAWDRNEVKVDAVKTGRDNQALKEAQIVVEASPNAVEIKTKYPENCHDCHPAAVEYTLSVPRQAVLDHIDAVNGSVSIEGVTGSVKANSVNGAVAVRGAAADADLGTVNGRIDADYDRIVGKRVSLHTVNGVITLNVPQNFGARLKASTVHGGINSNFDLPVRHAGFGPGSSLESTIGDGSVEIHLSTVNGGINLNRR